MLRAAVLVSVPFWGLFVEEAGERAPQRAAQVRQESAFNPSARSPVGARGIGQHMPANWPWYVQMGWIQADADPWDPRMGIRAQDRLMTWLETRLGSWPKALAGYNCGEGGVRRAMKRAKGRGLIDTPERALWEDYLPEETRNYIRVIPEKHLPWVNRQIGRPA